MSKPPEFYLQMKDQHPALMDAYETLAGEAKKAGPLDDKTVALTKLAISLGAGLEGASHSAVRKAVAAGCSAAEIRQVALLGVTTLGFPSMMRCRAWIEDVLSKTEG